MSLFRNEPAIIGFVVAFLALLVAFHLNISEDQIKTIVGVITAGLALFVRGNVTPV